MHQIKLTHSFDAAHRVVGHTAADGSPGKCSRLHGHTYNVEYTVGAEFLDDTGFVVDFGRLKALANVWDHRTLLWHQDPFAICGREGRGPLMEVRDEVSGVVQLPFNPTSENLAQLLAYSALDLDPGRIVYAQVTVSETLKSGAVFTANVRDRKDASARAVSEPTTAWPTSMWRDSVSGKTVGVCGREPSVRCGDPGYCSEYGCQL